MTGIETNMSARGRGGRGGRQNSSFGRGRGFTARGGRGREMEGPPSFVVGTSDARRRVVLFM